MNFDWTDDAVGVLEQRWAAGESARLIADALGITRSAVLGKLHRMGAQRRTTLATHDRASKTKQNSAAFPPAHDRCVAADTRAEPSSYSGSALFSAPIEEMPRRLSLDELREDTCRFPLGDPGQPDFGFCGAATEPHSSYCRPHHSLCHYWVHRCRA